MHKFLLKLLAPKRIQPDQNYKSIYKLNVPEGVNDDGKLISQMADKIIPLLAHQPCRNVSMLMLLLWWNSIDRCLKNEDKPDQKLISLIEFMQLYLFELRVDVGERIKVNKEDK